MIAYEGHRGVVKLVMDLNQMYQEYGCLYELDSKQEGFEWINCNSPMECYVSFVRKGKQENDILVCVANFSGVEKTIRLGVPYIGKYKEVLNTDSVQYDGTGIVNPRVKKAKEIEWDGRAYSIDVNIAPLSVAVFAYQPYTKAELEKIRIEKEKRAEKERIEREKREERERIEREKREEKERIEREKREERERIEREKQAEKERLKREQEEKERLKREAELKAKREKETKERLEREKQEKEKAEQSLAALRKTVMGNKGKGKKKSE